MPVLKYLVQTVIVVVYIIFLQLDPTQGVVPNLRYCDGDKLVTLTSDQCSGGINFGEKKPECVCISGIYRFWMDTCLLHEGYSVDGCSTLYSWDDNMEENRNVPPYERKTLAQVVGIQFALPNSNLPINFFNDTVAVFSESGTDYEPMKMITFNESAKTEANQIFYTNAEIYTVARKGDSTISPDICVGKRGRGSRPKLCSLKRPATNPYWNAHFGEQKIYVTDQYCYHIDKNVLLAERLPVGDCLDMITKERSECSLPCAPNEGLGRRPGARTGEDDIDENEDGKVPPEEEVEGGGPEHGEREKSSESGSFEKGGSGKDKGKGKERDDGSSEGRTIRPLKNKNFSSDTTNLKDCKEPTIGEIKTQHNAFLNRKLNHWSKLRQVGQLDKPMLSKIKPTRTFRTLDIVKQIAQRTCPPQFVSPMFFDQAVDLFVILHKGREYRYTEDLQEKDSLWIQKILHKCNMDAKTISLYSDDTSDSGCNDFEWAEGYCRSGNMLANNCEKVPLNISEAHSKFEHHFVVDVAWNIIDLVQIVCFGKFAESYRMLHAWEQSSEKLFTREIRKLWAQPKLDKKVYQNLLTPTAIIDMYNLEMCIEAAYNMNPILTRLLRPPEPKKFFRKKRSAEDDADRVGGFDVFCRKSPENFYTPC